MADKPSLKRLLWAGPLTIVIAVMVNLILRFIATALLQPSESFIPLSARGPVAPFTVIGTLGAVIVFALVAQFAPSPIRTYRIISVVALSLTFIPDMLLLFGPRSPAGAAPPVGGPPPMEGVTFPNVLALMTMHVAAWAVCAFLLPRLTRSTPAQ